MKHAHSSSERLPITVIGMNPDTVLDSSRTEALLQADILYTSPRHRALIEAQRPNLSGNWQMWQSPLEQSLQNIKRDHESGKRIVVIASGDPMCYGIGATINRFFTELELMIIPAPSSFCLATARLQWASQDTLQISLHRGDDQQILPHLEQRKKILCLTKNQDSPNRIADILHRNGWGQSIITILEELGGTHERIRECTAQDLSNKKLEFQSLNIVGIQPIPNRDTGQKSSLFIKDQSLAHDGQLTKFAFRAVTLATLNPSQNRQLWDIGAGSGAISLSWIKLGGRAIAIEQHPERCSIIRQNTKNYTTPSFQLYEGDAEHLLKTVHQNHPAPEAIFFGGALHLMKQAMPMLQTGGVLVANAVTLASQQTLMEIRLNHGGQIRRISIEEEAPIGNFAALKPTRTVMQYWWQKS